MIASRRQILTLLSGAAALASGCASGASADHLRLFDVVWRYVRDDYYDADALGRKWQEARRLWRPKARQAESQADLYYNVLIPMLERLNASHIRLRPAPAVRLPREASIRLPGMRRGDRLAFLNGADEAGLGAELTWDGEALIASWVERGGVAEIAGLLTGDAVAFSGYRGTPTGGQISLIRAGTGQTLVMDWDRKAPSPNRIYRPFGVESAYVRFDQFEAKSIDWLFERLKKPHRSLILDLRRNGGGALFQCHRLLSGLLPANTPLGAFQMRDGSKPMRASPGPTISAEKLILLTSLRTMSSAEILCASLKAHRDASLIGERTAGAVLLSRIKTLPDGGTLMLPYADYLTSSGRRLEGVGVLPTIQAGGLDEAGLIRRAEALALSL